MKKHPIRLRRRILTGLVPVLTALMLSGSAQAVTILAMLPAGPIFLDDVVTVEVSISGWDSADGQVDAVAFNVDFLTTVFEFVPGSGTVVSDGTEFLAQVPNQGAGYNLADNSDDSLVSFGRYRFDVEDDIDGTGGSEGPDGPVGSFQLKAIGLGTGTVTPSATVSFADEALNPITTITGGVTLTDDSIEVVIPEPSSGLLCLVGLVGLTCMRRRRR